METFQAISGESKISILQFCLIVALLMILVIHVEAQVPAKDGLKLTGAVSKVEVYENEANEFSHSVVIVHIDFALTNSSNETILLFEKNPDCSGVGIAKTEKDLSERSGTYALFNFWAKADFVDDQLWNSTVKTLDKIKPVAGKIHFLMPKQIVSYRDEVRFDLPKDKQRTFEASPWPRPTLDEFLKLSPMFMSLERCSLLGYGIAPEKPNRLSFAKKLQKRWAKFGNLWLDEIESAPIPLDLGTAVVRTAVEP